MYFSRFGRGMAAAIGRGLVVLIVLAGCAPQEELKLDPGASPFYPAVSDEQAAPSVKGGLGTGPRSNADLAATRGTEGNRGAAQAESRRLNTALGSNEVELQLRIARRAAERGERIRAAVLLDQVLAAEPLNREALFVRASLALDQTLGDSPLGDRAAAMAKATELARAMHRAYEPLKELEQQLLARVFYREAQIRVLEGRDEEAITVLKDASNFGFDLIHRAESDKSLGAFPSSPRFQATLKAIETERLTKARERVTERLAQPLDIPFNFTLPDLDGKSVALADLKGKVVVLDFWGTWCGPCRQVIPHLAELYKTLKSQGLVIVGLTYEKGESGPLSESQARPVVKKFVQQAAIPYPCLIGDEATLKQVPGFKGFPTTVVIDQAGKVRLVITENDGKSLELIEDVVRVLLAGGAEKKTDTAGKTK
jgi:thiol-disulfide isomerase/thioredoxin